MFVKNILIIFWFCCPLVNLAKRFLPYLVIISFFLLFTIWNWKHMKRIWSFPSIASVQARYLLRIFIYARVILSFRRLDFRSGQLRDSRIRQCFRERDLIPVFATCQRTLINDFNVVFPGDFCIKKRSVVDKLFRVFPITFPIEGFTAREWKYISSGRYKY